MISFTKSNIFDIDCDAFVNPINTMGVVSGGIEFQFKKRFRKNFISYREAIIKKKISLGKPFIIKSGPKFIINLPIKDDWRDSPNPEIILKGLENIRKEAEKYSIKRIGMPILSSGVSQSRIDDFKEIIMSIFTNSEIEIIISETTISE